MSMAEFFKDLKPYTAYQHVWHVGHVWNTQKSRKSADFSQTCSPDTHQTGDKKDVCLDKGKDVCKNSFDSGPLKTPQTCQTPQMCDFEHIQNDYEERAAIIEFDGKLSRAEAETFAYHELLAVFVTEQHPEIIKAFQSRLLNNRKREEML